MYDTLLKNAIEASLLAGEAIMDIHHQKNYSIQKKLDQTPVTEADFRSHDIIVRELKRTKIEILSEEGSADSWAEIRRSSRYWLIDPLDGTKEFIKGNGEFTVNIALMEDEKPILGVIYIPVQQILYAGDVNSGAWRWNEVAPKSLPDWEVMKSNAQSLPLNIAYDDYRVLGSKSFRSAPTDNFMKKLGETIPNIKIVRAGSSIKFCMIASGEADLYPRLDNIMQWDVAAGHAIVEASGGIVKSWPDGSDIRYTAEDMRFTKFMAATRGGDFDLFFK
ncbi:MAG TPA: 3'(2'),5'-bisphosphate nucleotidase CysQ [Marinilabiliaceae bacterium]|nr:3'(2'),5'-bisphosphate nucleotidase CysQ [Marinilabiliaceae bacterium]